jgi:hypothetical protein
LSPTHDDAALTLLAALRTDLQSFRDEWKRDLNELVTKPVFESEMRRRDDVAKGLEAAINRESEARRSFSQALSDERAERRITTRWLVTMLGAPVAGLVVNQIFQLFILP